MDEVDVIPKGSYTDPAMERRYTEKAMFATAAGYGAALNGW